MVGRSSWFSSWGICRRYQGICRSWFEYPKISWLIMILPIWLAIPVSNHSRFTSRKPRSTLIRWWFPVVSPWWVVTGTLILSSHILGMIIPIKELIFLRGVQTTNQLLLVNEIYKSTSFIQKKTYICIFLRGVGEKPPTSPIFHGEKLVESTDCILQVKPPNWWMPYGPRWPRPL